MKFIAIDRAAVTEIISNRTMQSIEFENGLALAALLQNPAIDSNPSTRLTFWRNEYGLFILHLGDKPSDYVVFDLETCRLFDAKNSEADVLLYLQKVLRFSIKYWGTLKLSVNERVIANSSKAVVFPHPISQQTSFRISIELAPDSKRQSKRSPDDRSILVYRSGTDEGGGPQKNVSQTNFRRFLESRRSIPDASKAEAKSSASITALTVTTLDRIPAAHVEPYQGYERWLQLLTEKQKAFVLSDLTAPHRLEGPAGSGKTLCLILKAIAGLHRASDAKLEHKALFITHSEATRRAIEHLIRINDPWNCLDAAAEMRVQTLKLTTLQQLCGELLQREIAESEFLDRDAMESKQLQFMYVEEALKDARESEYPTYKSILSHEFEDFLSRTDLAALAEMFQHEIRTRQ